MIKFFEGLAFSFLFLFWWITLQILVLSKEHSIRSDIRNEHKGTLDHYQWEDWCILNYITFLIFISSQIINTV